MEPDSVQKFSHILLNSFGGGNDIARATIHHLELNSDDQLVLCTDGLTDMVDDSKIAEVLSRGASSQEGCQALLDLALEAGGKDNITVVLAHLSIPD